MFKKLGTYVPGTSTSLIYHKRGGGVVLEKNLPSEASANSTAGRPTEVGRPNVYHVDRVPET